MNLNDFLGDLPSGFSFNVEIYVYCIVPSKISKISFEQQEIFLFDTYITCILRYFAFALHKQFFLKLMFLHLTHCWISMSKLSLKSKEKQIESTIICILSKGHGNRIEM
jgi:hypothetical protein